MVMTAIADEEINGASYQILVDGTGTFYAEVDGVMVQAVTKAQLIDRLKLLKRPRRVAVAATLVHFSRGLVPITLTGIHAANKNVVYRIAGETGSQQLSGYGSDEVLRALSADEMTEHAALVKAARMADKAVEKWLAARRVHPKTLIEAARSDAEQPA